MARRIVMIVLAVGSTWVFSEPRAAAPVPTQVQPHSAPIDTKGAPSWSSLSAGQRAALKPLEGEWRGIGPDHKKKWLEIAAQFPAMSADERLRIQARMTEWAALTPQQRGTARFQFKQAQQLAPSNRAARWEAYQALPEAERKQLASRAEPAVINAAALRRARSAEAADGSPSGVQAKSNVVAAPDASRPVRSVTPTLVQAPTGATTRLISERPTPPVHEHTGLPKIAASPNFVNPATLLPRRGAQGAAVIATGASAPLVRP